MIHPHTQLRYINEEMGCGVFASQVIPRGTIIWVRDGLDRVMPLAELEQLDPMPGESALKYCYRNCEGHYVLCWDHNRYVNHSFTPNCMTTPYGLELAVHNIAEGEELTNDYGTLNIIESFEPLDEERSRKVVHPDDLTRHHEEWDSLLEAAFADLAKVDQPLRPLLDDSIWQACLRIADGAESMRSIRECHFPG